MFTKPEIFNPVDLSRRGHVSFYYNKIRKRYYDGSQVGLECTPSKCTTHKERQNELERLQYHLHKLLLAGWEPSMTAESPGNRLVTDLQEERFDSLYPKHLSKRQKQDAWYAADRFRKYLIANNLGHIRTNSVTRDQIQDYLDTVVSSNSYYMIVRNRLSGIFGLFMEKKMIAYNPVKGTKTRTKSVKRHRAFTEQEFKTLLDFLKKHDKKLYLCALFMYGCFLRPHEEIRKLKRDHFNEELTTITMDSDENKSRRLRVVPIPSYIREEMLNQGIDKLRREYNIFSRQLNPYQSEDYFATCWKRIKPDLIKRNIISADHTLYSIRHTAAVLLFKRTQDLSKLSQLMGHADVNVTLVYLRSLGVLLNITENDLPMI